MTFFTKCLFPATWSAGWGYGTLELLLHPGTVAFNGVPGAAPPGLGAVMLVVWAIATPLMFAFGWRLKRVRLTADALLVSNYLREIRIPLREVADVTRSHFPHNGGIAVHLLTPTAFGSIINFVPKNHAGLDSPDKLVDELNTLVAHASG